MRCDSPHHCHCCGLLVLEPLAIRCRLCRRHHCDGAGARCGQSFRHDTCAPLKAAGGAKPEMEPCAFCGTMTRGVSFVPFENPTRVIPAHCGRVACIERASAK